MGGVLLGALIALAGSLGTVALQASLQRKALRGEYLWNKRAELYLDVLRHGNGHIAHLGDGEADTQYGWTPGVEELRQDLTARVQLFGSAQAEAHWRALSRSSRRLDSYVLDNLLTSSGDRAVLDPARARNDHEYLRLEGEASAARRALVTQLRRELNTDQYLRRGA
ncbi:hypothetical protein EOT10_03115 [Streptomyces antnestii]|uniref:Uncharacterized protein n=1 Tax=Streptomyces antnestii TaxID=2494256 RepID=A0A3S2Z4Z1_9ACTN|nr:hypothetical protein [Streptomyces sp. San01]RVU28865.1 hypothetical protein EOT10_03115 [Streptomyces sp. San01]